eukprot:snap_masked-scaffold636_size121610-processed-gene-0.2 protein:Tk09993 transcript:snap_masked-scaffold636_size121610-processed-gene-0.2-mRNA-1 annotation:"o-sialoglycoprotein endopeptidase"
MGVLLAKINANEDLGMEELDAFESSMDFSAFGISQNMGFILMLLIFIIAMAALLLCVKYLHKLPIKNLITASSNINWGEVVNNPMSRTVENFVGFAMSGYDEPLSTHADHFNSNAAYGAGSYSKGAIFLAQLKYIVLRCKDSTEGESVSRLSSMNDLYLINWRGVFDMIVKVNGYNDMEVLGETIDDAAGEAFDKTGKIMGLDYPAGPLIDKYAALGQPIYEFTEPKIDGLNFSFSGLKTSIMYFLKKQIKEQPDFITANMNDICASVQERIVSILINKITLASFTVPFLHDSGMIGIGITVVIIGVASLNLLLDFDNFEKGEQAEAPKFMEWYYVNTAFFGDTPQGEAGLVTLTNDHGMVVKVTNYGAIITSIIVPDKDGKAVDVLLGFDNIEQYLDKHPHFGGLIG